jgi:hypothetical protein
VKEKLGIELNRRQVDHEPIRTLGTHTVNVRLTIDLIPKITVIVHREGEAVGPAKEIQAEVSTQADSEEPPADSLYEEEETAELLAETGVEE